MSSPTRSSRLNPILRLKSLCKIVALSRGTQPRRCQRDTVVSCHSYFSQITLSRPYGGSRMRAMRRSR
ncbi:hypothetical protein [Clavibacter phage 33]|nr:hypothetical protein [Clavibacter phage 33]